MILYFHYAPLKQTWANHTENTRINRDALIVESQADTDLADTDFLLLLLLIMYLL